MSRSFVTVAVPIAAGLETDVREAVRGLGNPASAAVRNRLEPLRLMHFMSITVITAAHLPHGFLLIELAADGCGEAALRALAGGFGTELAFILTTAGAAYVPTDIAGFLMRHQLTIATDWVSALRLNHVVGLPFDGLPGMTIGRIREEERLARAIVAAGKLHGHQPAHEKLRAIRHAIWADGTMKWAFAAADAPFLGPAAPASAGLEIKIFIRAVLPLIWPLLLVIPVAALLIGLATGGDGPIWLPAIVVSIAVWAALGVLGYRRLVATEAADVPDDTAPGAAEVSAIMAGENGSPLNLLVTVSRIKPGWFRRLTLRTAVRITQTRVAQHGRPGFLGANGEIGTLHAGRWLVLPGTDLLVFVAHYDGSWLSYMQDFIDLIAFGPTGIWSNTRGFPRTRLLFSDGAKDGDRVTRWFHRQQVAADFWYADAPGLTLSRIRANAAVRQGFAKAETEREAAAWLSLFGAPSPPVRESLPRESREIPTLVFGALTRHRHAVCLALAFGDDTDRCRAWLAALAPGITYGHAPKGEGSTAHVLGLAASGLRRLGLDATDLATFPVAFLDGMGSAARARVLGDAPGTWEWGGDSPVDAVLLVYAETGDALDAALRALPDPAAVTVRRRIDCQVRRKGDMTEPFGFRDGVSQPVIPGTPTFERSPPPDQVVSPGEFVLGYKDNRGYYPPVPTVDACRDPAGDLPRLAGGQASLGADSSFLVIRQLRQHKVAFDTFAKAEAHARGTNPEYIKAKLIGRWPDGSSLVRNPHGPGGRPDNDFRYGQEDADGLACPLGAHVRRANPRDALRPDLGNAVEIVNRRRILRVGRPYVPPPAPDAPDAASDNKPEGMLFMCLNADIERQFELVQQAWLRNPDFDRLHDEADPLVGQRDGVRDFTIPTGDGPVCLRGLPDFVTMLGGGYFWLPSARAVRFLSRPRA